MDAVRCDMFRTVLSMIGIVEIVAPKALIDTAERLALDNPDECELKSWVVPGARVEGFVFLLLMWRNEASYSAFKRFLGVIGLLASIYPRAYIDYSAELAYTDARSCNWKPWVYPATRLVGLLYVLIALDELRDM